MGTLRLGFSNRTATVLLLVATAGCAGPPATAAPVVSAVGSASSAPSSAPSDTATPPDPQPPAALLSVGGGAGVPGALGTYTYLGAGSDAPWLPGTPTAIPPAGGRAEIVLQPPIAHGAWTLKETAPGDRGGAAAREIASGSGPIVFTLPPRAGTVALLVQFAENAGGAAYFWAVRPG